MKVWWGRRVWDVCHLVGFFIEALSLNISCVVQDGNKTVQKQQKYESIAIRQRDGPRIIKQLEEATGAIETRIRGKQGEEKKGGADRKAEKRDCKEKKIRGNKCYERVEEDQDGKWDKLKVGKPR